MKISKKQLTNIAFVLLIGLMIFPPTKVYFIRLFSFSPSIESVENQHKITIANWKLKGLNAKNIDIKDLNNKVVFVSFWATWCPPCIAEMPSMKALYEDYKDKVTFLFITNEDWNTVNKFYNKRSYDFPTYNELTSTPKELKSTTIPATYILSKDHNVMVAKKGAANWNADSIRSLLDTLIK